MQTLMHEQFDYVERPEQGCSPTATRSSRSQLLHASQWPDPQFCMMSRGSMRPHSYLAGVRREALKHGRQHRRAGDAPHGADQQRSYQVRRPSQVPTYRGPVHILANRYIHRCRTRHSSCSSCWTCIVAVGTFLVHAWRLQGHFVDRQALHVAVQTIERPTSVLRRPTHWRPHVTPAALRRRAAP